VQGLAAGRQHAQAWAAAQERVGKFGTRLDQAFAVVQHKQHLTARQEATRPSSNDRSGRSRTPRNEATA
jgi:hypothetical protein